MVLHERHTRKDKTTSIVIVMFLLISLKESVCDAVISSPIRSKITESRISNHKSKHICIKLGKPVKFHENLKRWLEGVVQE